MNSDKEEMDLFSRTLALLKDSDQCGAKPIGWYVKRITSSTGSHYLEIYYNGVYMGLMLPRSRGPFSQKPPANERSFRAWLKQQESIEL